MPLELTAFFGNTSKTLCGLSIRMLLLNVAFMWTLVLNLLINACHLLGSPSNLRIAIGGKPWDSMSFYKMILSPVWRSAVTTAFLPSIDSSIHASMATILDVSLLFSEAENQYGCGLLFRCLVWNINWIWVKWSLLILICDEHCFKFWSSIPKINYFFFVGDCFQWHDWQFWINGNATGSIW